VLSLTKDRSAVGPVGRGRLPLTRGLPKPAQKAPSRSPPHQVFSDGPVLVADRQLEWERQNCLALFIRDDECATDRCMSVKNALTHALASECRGLLPYRFQVLKLDTFLIEHCRGFVFDVEEVTRHH